MRGIRWHGAEPDHTCGIRDDVRHDEVHLLLGRQRQPAHLAGDLGGHAHQDPRRSSSSTRSPTTTTTTSRARRRRCLGTTETADTYTYDSQQRVISGPETLRVRDRLLLSELEHRHLPDVLAALLPHNTVDQMGIDAMPEPGLDGTARQ